MISTDISNYYHFYPSNVTLVGAKRGDQVNFMAAAWNTGMSFDPPLFSVFIAPKRHTHDMILESGEFTCNFLSMEHLEIIHGTGRTSGRDIDKVKALGIPLQEPAVIGCTVIELAYAAYECKLIHHYESGDHSLFLGEVVALHCDEKLCLPDGLLDPTQVDFTLYLGANTYITTQTNTMKKMPAEIEIGEYLKPG
jgi:flavin reductase (DIM6/NTAB) family NADH-FMN oxidoreductase RutF